MFTMRLPKPTKARPPADQGKDTTRRKGSSLLSIPSFRRGSSESSMMDALFTISPNRRNSEQRGTGSDMNDHQIQLSPNGKKVFSSTFKPQPIASPSSTSNSSSSDFQQAGGHNDAFVTDGSTLVKKVTQREASFYEFAEQGLWPKELLPKYYGRVGDDSIRIENLVHEFARPCIIDLKMGVQTVEDDETSFLKKLKMAALDKVTRSNIQGCRLEGLSMYRTLENTKIKGTKVQSHSISARVQVSLKDVLTFFLTDESGVRTDIALRFQQMVKKIRKQFETNNSYRFIGSSILLIYDNDNKAPYMRWARALRKVHTLNPKAKLSEDQISGLTRRTRIDVRMIDFAHTGPMPNDMKKDDGYITGLETILSALSAIRKYRAKPIFSFGNAVVDVMEEQRALAQSSAENLDGTIDNDFTFGTLLKELTPLAEQGQSGSSS